LFFCITQLVISNKSPKTDTNDEKVDINVTLSNTTTKCPVNCENGTKTTTIVSYLGKKSAEAGKFQIDDSLECVTTLKHTECQGNGSNCPGTYHVIRKYKNCGNK
jgi:hypothetical protein